MKFFTIKLKEEFPFLKSKQEPTLTCYVNDNSRVLSVKRANPAMLIAPGGGYANVSMCREGEQIAFSYLKEGFSCFVLDYSVNPETYPQQLMEIACAIHYIRKNATEWNIDVNKVSVTGYSAGGHLAASLGVFWNDPFILDALKLTGEDIRPDAMVLGYPVISADSTFAHMGSIINVSGTTDANSPIFKKMSLENQVNENTPPTFLWHTADDALVNVKNSLAFATALADNKVKFELHVYPFGYHGLATSDFATNNFTEKHYTAPWMDESVKFLFDLWYNGKEYKTL